MVEDVVKELNEAAKTVAKHFFEKTERKATSGLFMQQFALARQLINDGFRPEEIMQGIDWLIANPPRNGFHSIGYLAYVLDDILIKTRITEMKEQMKQQAINQDYEQYADLCKNENYSNAQKFQQQSKPKVKGS